MIYVVLVCVEGIGVCCTKKAFQVKIYSGDPTRGTIPEDCMREDVVQSPTAETVQPQQPKEEAGMRNDGAVQLQNHDMNSGKLLAYPMFSKRQMNFFPLQTLLMSMGTSCLRREWKKVWNFSEACDWDDTSIYGNMFFSMMSKASIRRITGRDQEKIKEGDTAHWDITLLGSVLTIL